MRIASTAAAMALLAATLTGCAELRANAELPTASLITATGTGRVAVRPDTALAQLGAEARAASLADATADVAKRMTAVLERVRALGVQERDVTTVTYAVDPLVGPRRSEEEPPRILGYRAANIVQLRIRQLDAVGRILDAAVAAGANTLRGLVFTVADPAPIEAQARALAVQSAGAKAQQLAAAAGVRLGELVRITEGEPPVRPAAERLAVTALTTGPGPIEPGQHDIVVTVTAHYRIAQ
jgi:uncharacterized protein